MRPSDLIHGLCIRTITIDIRTIIIDEYLVSGPPPPEAWAHWMAEAHAFASKGYRRVSRRRGTLVRVDREDWHQALAQKFPRMVPDADFYRRVLSQDKVTVSRYVSEMVPSSCGDHTGYVP